MDVDTHLGNKEVSTNAFLQSEAVKEEIAETNTKAIKRIKTGSNEICSHEDTAMENIMFSQESSQAMFEMGNMEPRKWYDVSKQLWNSQSTTSVRLCLRQAVFNTALTCGRNTTTKQKTHYEIRKRTKEIIRRSGIDGKMKRPSGSLNSPLVGQMLG